MAERFAMIAKGYSEKLDECPHCKGKAEIHEVWGGRYAVTCMTTGCGAMMLYTGKSDSGIVGIHPVTQMRTLVERWNRRDGKWKEKGEAEC